MAQLRANTGLRLVRHGREMLLEGGVRGVSPRTRGAEGATAKTGDSQPGHLCSVTR